jgi:hypothetical protein
VTRDLWYSGTVLDAAIKVLRRRLSVELEHVVDKDRDIDVARSF